MRSPIRHLRRFRVAMHPLALCLTTLVLVVACGTDDPFPTSPSIVPVPLPAVLGADVTGLGFETVAINGAGQVAGTLNGHAVRWTPGSGTQDLGTLGGASSRAYAINEAGQVAGASATATGATHAFLWTPGQGMRDLGTLPGGASSIARGMNDRGEVVGQSTRPRVDPLDPRPPLTRAFRWTLFLGMEDLGTLGSLNGSIAYDINNVGQVVGRAYSVDRDIFPPTDPEFFSHAFLWTPGQGMQDIGALSGGFSIAHAINDVGTVVGRSWVSRPTSIVYHAFRWTLEGGMRDLGAFALSSDSSVAYGINNSGQIVGSSKVGMGDFFADYTVTNAFIWTESEGLENLTPTTGITTARAINDRQQVVGDGRVATVQLAPGNVLPVAKAGGPYTGTEGSEVPFNMSGTDLDGGILSGDVRYGDGTWDVFYTMLPNPRPSGPGKHLYADNGTYTLTLIVIDSRGGRDTATAPVSIANVAPAILAGSLTGPTAPLQLIGGVASAPIAFEFRDPAGSNDVYAAEVACGNGVVLTATNIQVAQPFGFTGAYTGSCTYTSAGVYTVRATVSDEDGGVSEPAFYRSVVVYDPDGASAKGSGFHVVTDRAKGKGAKAHFTFDVVYPAGSPSAPNGTAKVWIPGGQLDFESTAIELLVASGNRAQFWGSGTLNGAAARFRITALDGGRGSGAIRIELWNAAGTSLLYDTQPGAALDAPPTTTIDGGNIQIRNE